MANSTSVPRMHAGDAGNGNGTVHDQDHGHGDMPWGMGICPHSPIPTQFHMAYVGAVFAVAALGVMFNTMLCAALWSTHVPASSAPAPSAIPSAPPPAASTTRKPVSSESVPAARSQRPGPLLLLANIVVAGFVYAAVVVVAAGASLWLGSPAVSFSSASAGAWPCRLLRATGGIFDSAAALFSIALLITRRRSVVSGAPVLDLREAQRICLVLWTLVLLVELPPSILLSHFPMPTEATCAPFQYNIPEQFRDFELNPAFLNRSLWESSPNPWFFTGPSLSLIIPLIMIVLVSHTFLMIRQAESDLLRTLSSKQVMSSLSFVSTETSNSLAQIGHSLADFNRVAPETPSQPPAEAAPAVEIISEPLPFPIVPSIAITAPPSAVAVQDEEIAIEFPSDGKLEPVSEKHVKFNIAAQKAISKPQVKSSTHIQMQRAAICIMTTFLLKLTFHISYFAALMRDKSFPWIFHALAYLLFLSTTLSYPILILYVNPNVYSQVVFSVVGVGSPSNHDDGTPFFSPPSPTLSSPETPALPSAELRSLAGSNVTTLRRGIPIDDFQHWWIQQQQHINGVRRQRSLGKRGVEYPIEATSDMYTFSVGSNAEK
eukprot:jgi/Hompol1/4815/HPOL_003899-RA